MTDDDFRESIRGALIEFARAAESGVDAAALVGSAARGEEDQWSDIDLALRVVAGGELAGVAECWSTRLAALSPVADEFDVHAGAGLYRVFLLRTGLQVDLSFWPAGEFASTGQAFELIFGAADPVLSPSPADGSADVAYAWLHALHIRSALGRGRLWQALEMLDGMRTHVIALACRRHHLEPYQGRGVDKLPGEVLRAFETTRPPARSAEQIGDSFSALTRLLLAETSLIDPDRAERLTSPLLDLSNSAR